jgi:ABC-type hemin transport system ATPase subunit
MREEHAGTGVRGVDGDGAVHQRWPVQQQVPSMRRPEQFRHVCCVLRDKCATVGSGGINHDVGQEFVGLPRQLAAQGEGILFISSELEELLGMCDRILVMNQGEIITEFERSAFDKEQILRSAFREGSDPS